MSAQLLSWLEASTWMAVLGAALWGLVSILLSPCHLASIPLLVGFLGRLEGQALSDRKLSLWVTLGESLSLIAVAALSLAAGRIAGDLWGVGPWLMVAFLLSSGLLLLGVVELPSFGQLRPERARAGAIGAVAAGGMLGVTFGPCTFGFFAPIVAVSVGEATFTLRAATALAFVAAHLGATWGVGVFGARIGGWLQQGGGLARWVKGSVGALAIAMAVEMIINNP